MAHTVASGVDDAGVSAPREAPLSAQARVTNPPVDKTVEQAFKDYCVFDGRTAYVPRERLMPALQFMGLNPTFRQLEDLVPAFDEDSRVFFGEFRACHEALKRTRLYGRDALIEAFRVFDSGDKGWLSARDFGRAMSSSDDSLSRKETSELLRIADPDATGRVDYVAFAHILYPSTGSAKGGRGAVGASAAAAAEGDAAARTPEAAFSPPRYASPGPSGIESPVRTPPPAALERDDPRGQKVREQAIAKFEAELIAEGDACQQERAKLLTDLRAIYLELQAPAFASFDTVESARVLLTDDTATNSDCVRRLQKLLAAVWHGRKTVADAELRLRDVTATMLAQRRAADEKFMYLPDEYDAPVYDSVRAHLMILWQCRHRIVTNSWSPFTDSARAQAEFLRGCGGEDSAYRGSTPSPLYADDDMTQEEEVALMIGSYIHHGTSTAFTCPPLCLLPPQMLDEYAESAAAKMLVVPCELENLKCGVDKDTGEARACRACFYDGVNGRAFEPDGVLPWLEEMICDEAERERMVARLRTCHRRGVWYHHEAQTCRPLPSVDGDVYGRGLPHAMLVPRERCLEALDGLRVRVDAAGRAAQFLETEFRTMKAVVINQADANKALQDAYFEELNTLHTQYISEREALVGKNRHPHHRRQHNNNSTNTKGKPSTAATAPSAAASQASHFRERDLDEVTTATAPQRAPHAASDAGGAGVARSPTHAPRGGVAANGRAGKPIPRPKPKPKKRGGGGCCCGAPDVA